jgi:hypothetical protein
VISVLYLNRVVACGMILVFVDLLYVICTYVIVVSQNSGVDYLVAVLFILFDILLG